MNFLKRAYIWCKRFRYRKGYGVHSPFAFSLLTDVVYERRPYYAYEMLDELAESMGKVPRYSRRVNRLLFRLVNYFRPERIVEVGTGGGISLRYMAAGRVDADCVSLCEEVPDEAVSLLFDECKNGRLQAGPIKESLAKELEITPPIGLLHIAHTADYAQVFEKFLPHATEKTLVVIEGIYESSAKRAWWKKVVNDPRTGITFDLYELGLVFFDKSKNKQHYIVNF